MLCVQVWQAVIIACILLTSHMFAEHIGREELTYEHHVEGVPRATAIDENSRDRIPADWFVAAADEFGTLGEMHPIFMDGNQRSRIYGTSAGVYHTEFGITTAKDLRQLASIFRLRFAYVALGAASSREVDEFRQSINLHHKRALAGHSQQDKILDEPTNSDLLHALRGKSLPINKGDIPPIPIGGTIRSTDLPQKGMGFGGICNREKLLEGHYDRCDQTFLEQFEHTSVLSKAIKAGNRLFDSAWLYGSDKIIGRGMANSTYPRSEFFVMTKLIPDNFLPSAVQLDSSRWGPAKISEDDNPLDYFERQLAELGTSYVDALCSHHVPEERFTKLWMRMEQLQSDGKVRLLCTSGPGDFILYQQCVQNGQCRKQENVLVQTEWSPCSGDPGGLPFTNVDLTGSTIVVHDLARCRNEPLMEALARHHNTSFFKVALSWAEAIGAIGLFKSINPRNIELNLAPPLALSREEIALLFGLQSLYVMSPQCEDLHLGQNLKYDPLGIRSLYADLEANAGSSCNLHFEITRNANTDECTHADCNAESRIDEDGREYTRSEFIEFYGDENGALKWNAAGVRQWNAPSYMKRATEKRWSKLYEYEKKAAQAIGYSMYEWDNNLENDVLREMFMKTWAELSSDQRRHWETLGWNAEMWDDKVGAGHV